MTRNILLHLSIAFLVASCATTVPYEQSTDGILGSYRGHPYHRAIQEMGPPDYIYSDGAEGRILHWEESTTTTRPGLSYTTSSGSADINVQTWDNVLWGDVSSSGTSYTITRPPSTVTSTKFIQFYVQPDGYIYNYRTNMLSPAEQQARKSTYWLKVSGYTLGITAVALLALQAGEQE